jgi:hypothetical protein
MACVVMVRADAGVLPLSFDLVESLLRSDGVARRAAGHIENSGHDTLDAVFEVQPLGGEDLGDGYRNPLPSGGREPINPAPPAGTRTVVLALRVHLPDGVPPLAREFGDALLKHLRDELQEVYAAYREDLARQLADAQTQRETARKELDYLMRPSSPAAVEEVRPDPADRAVYEQLERVVNLSAIAPQTAAGEAFDLLRNSVQPPLNLVVLWRDLLENALIEPTSPVELDGSPAIRLGTALENLLLAMTDPLATSDDYRLDYVVSHGVITVATRLGLPSKKIEIRVYDLPPLLRAAGQAPEIAALIRETIEPESWFDACPRSGDGTIASSPEGRLVISQSRDVHRRIQELMAELGANASVALPLQKSQENLTGQMESLLAHRLQLERELDHLQERQGQLNRETKDRQRQGRESALRMTRDDLGTTLMELRAVYTDEIRTEPGASKNARLQQAIERIGQCVDRCDNAVPGRGFRFLPDPRLLHEDWQEEQTVASRIAGKQRDLRAISRRIEDIQRVLAGSSASDPESSHLRRVAERCEQMDIRVHELEARLADLRPCSVQVMGDIRWQ